MDFGAHFWLKKIEAKFWTDFGSVFYHFHGVRESKKKTQGFGTDDRSNKSKIKKHSTSV